MSISEHDDLRANVGPSLAELVARGNPGAMIEQELATRQAKAKTEMSQARFNQAILDITARLFPNGFDVLPADKAPNTWQECLDYATRHNGKMAVADTPDPMGIFTEPSVYHAFRAWHDWTHVYCGCQFTPNGEAMAARIQECVLASHYGPDQAHKWMRPIHREIMVSNYGEDAMDESKVTVE